MYVSLLHWPMRTDHCNYLLKSIVDSDDYFMNNWTNTWILIKILNKCFALLICSFLLLLDTALTHCFDMTQTTPRPLAQTTPPSLAHVHTHSV